MEAAVEAVEETRWLTGEEQQAWFALAGMVSWLPDVLDAQLQRDAGISHFEYSVMAMLSMSPERTMRMSEVGALANGALPRLSRTVDRLEKRGWVTRRPDPQDGRSTLAVLTDAGWEKVVATAPGHVAEVRRAVFDPITKTQVRQLADIASRVRRVVHPDGCPPPLPAPATPED
jgi:DNA-binding MarR family transcriptional regulator